MTPPDYDVSQFPQVQTQVFEFFIQVLRPGWSSFFSPLIMSTVPSAESFGDSSKFSHQLPGSKVSL